MRYVVDANVVVKTLVREPDSSVADALLDSHRHGQCSLLAPDILFAEIGNAMWKLVHLQKQITEDEARESINDVLSLGIFVTPAERLVQEALRIATSAGHPLYDCLYVALA